MPVNAHHLDERALWLNHADSVIGLVKSIHGQMRVKINRQMEAVSLTEAQWELVLQLAENGAHTASDLSRLCMRNSSSMTRTLDRLEAKSIVSRTRSRDDRRVINLELTEKGQRIASTLPALMREVSDQILTEFQSEETEQFRKYLQRLLSTLESDIH